MIVSMQQARWSCDTLSDKLSEPGYIQAGPWLCLVCEGIPAGLGSAAAGPARGFSSFGLSSLVCLGGFAVVLDQVVRVLLAPGRPWYI